MSITIDGTGTITGLSAGGLPDASVTTAEIANLAVTAGKLATSVASGVAKAWVNFNGTGTVAIRSSFNCSSVSDNGVGSYTVNFTTPMADVDYVCVATSNLNSSGGHNRIVSGPYTSAPTTSAYRLVTSRADTAGIEDQANISASFFD